jgi:hypothetical protein
VGLADEWVEAGALVALMAVDLDTVEAECPPGSARWRVERSCESLATISFIAAVDGARRCLPLLALLSAPAAPEVRLGAASAFTASRAWELPSDAQCTTVRSAVVSLLIPFSAMPFVKETTAEPPLVPFATVLFLTSSGFHSATVASSLARYLRSNDAAAMGVFLSWGQR